MKNQRLKLKDLFKGRVVYLVEPNTVPTKMVCGQKYVSTLTWSTIMFDNSGMSRDEILKKHNGEYVIASSEWLAKMASSSGNTVPEGVGLVRDYHTPCQGIEMTDNKGQKHYFQDIYFDPSESRLKVFSKLKQALRYSDYPEKFGAGLETIYSRSK